MDKQLLILIERLTKSLSHMGIFAPTQTTRILLK